jgi:tetratricopeptide (TPR) repeat protein
MKSKAVGLLLVGLAVLGARKPLVAAEITQTTGSGSWCSPAQNGNGNTVICNGVDPRAMDRLNELLDRKDLDLKQKTAEANDWVHRYNELNAEREETKKQLTAKGENATLLQMAQDLLHEGKLEQARAIFDRLIPSDEANVDRAARDYFGRASVFALQFRLDEALSDYAKAYQFRPDDQRFAEAYAYALQQQKDYPKAELVLQELLKHRRELAAQNPAAYQPDLALTLNSLATLYGTTQRFAEAEAALKEAAGIEREMAAQNPSAYRPDLAATLNNLGVLYDDTHRFAEAEAAYQEAAGIRRELAAQNPAAYRPDLAVTLTNLGALCDATQRFAEAEAALKEASGIERELAAQNPAAYRPDLAVTLTNLGALYADTQCFAEAEAASQEAAGIRRERAAQNPAAYQPDLAVTLNSLGALYGATQRFAEAEAALKEAAGIRRELAAQNPSAYRPDLAATLNNLGVLYDDTQRFAEAEAAYQEASGIRREHPLTAGSIDNLAGLLKDRGDFAGAQPLAERALRIREKVQGPLHPETATSFASLASLFAGKG